MKKIDSQQYAGIRVLVMGLGLHGGGVATVKWFVKRGALVTATDLRTEEVLAPSLRALEGVAVRLVLGRHEEADFREHDVIVANPGVPRSSPYLQIARDEGRKVVNDASIFFASCTNPSIGVTGTRGKTTTTQWIVEFLKTRYPKVRASGNTPENALLKEFDRVQGKHIPVVAELSSWQLESLPDAGVSPRISVITNLYPDHLNRYNNSLEEYALAKAGIFTQQGVNDILLLNADDSWLDFFLARAQQGQRVLFFSVKRLATKHDGVYVDREGMIWFRYEGEERKLFSSLRFVRERGAHNLHNLLAVLATVLLFDPGIRVTEAQARALPTPRMRQEIISQEAKISVVNDSCATSPDGTIAAIERFAESGPLVLIVGGTDKQLEFAGLAKSMKKMVPPAQVVFLSGSATTKLLDELATIKYFGKRTPLVFESLSECVTEAFDIARGLKKKSVLLFSPGGSSFEKFLHEFDRGDKFAQAVQRVLRVRKQ